MREGERERPLNNVPSFCSYDEKVEHYRVRRDHRGWVTVDDEEYFENLVKLVEVRPRDLSN